MGNNPMEAVQMAEAKSMTEPLKPFAGPPRCGAKTRRGTPCLRIGNRRNGRCILHGGRAGAPSGERNGNWKHGGTTKEAKAQRRMIRTLLREAGDLVRGDT